MISDADLNHSNILSSAQETTLLTARPPPSGLKTSRWHWRQPGGAHTCTLTHVFFSFSSPFPSSLYFPSSTYFSCTFICLSSSKSLHHHLTFFSPNDGYTQFTWDTSRALIWCMVTNIAYCNGAEPLASVILSTGVFPAVKSSNVCSEKGVLLYSFASLLSLSVGSVWVNSHSVSDPCMPVSGHKDSGTCTDGGQEVGF